MALFRGVGEKDVFFSRFRKRESFITSFSIPVEIIPPFPVPPEVLFSKIGAFFAAGTLSPGTTPSKEWMVGCALSARHHESSWPPVLRFSLKKLEFAAFD